MAPVFELATKFPAALPYFETRVVELWSYKIASKFLRKCACMKKIMGIF